MMRDHGGNIDGAIARFGGAPADWVDLSTGINRCPYPVGALPAASWQALPTQSARDTLHAIAARCYRAQQGAALIALAGAQAAIQLLPLCHGRGRARVLGPTYNEHAASLRSAGWAVDEVTTLDQLAGADLAVVVNPNNPDGRRHDPQALLALLDQVGTLIVDESFADPYPALSLAPFAARRGLYVLRSFGKFYGLAGLRLGFAIAAPDAIDRLRDMAGPWPVSGPAIDIATAALQDRTWADATARRLDTQAQDLDRIAAAAGWGAKGGTSLFRLYDTPDATAAQTRLARARIWSRIFPWSDRLIRLGLPGADPEWQRLRGALA